MRGSLNKIFFTLAVMFLAVAVVPVKASSATVDNTMSKEKIQAIVDSNDEVIFAEGEYNDVTVNVSGTKVFKTTGPVTFTNTNVSNELLGITVKTSADVTFDGSFTFVGYREAISIGTSASMTINLQENSLLALTKGVSNEGNYGCGIVAYSNSNVTINGSKNATFIASDNMTAGINVLANSSFTANFKDMALVDMSRNAKASGYHSGMETGVKTILTFDNVKKITMDDNEVDAVCFSSGSDTTILNIFNSNDVSMRRNHSWAVNGGNVKVVNSYLNIDNNSYGPWANVTYTASNMFAETLYVENSTIDANDCGSNNGIWVASNMTVIGSTINANRNGQSAYGNYNYLDTFLTKKGNKSSYSGNYPWNTGNGLALCGDVTITNSTINANENGGAGIGFYGFNIDEGMAKVEITSSTIIANNNGVSPNFTVYEEGSKIYNWNSSYYKGRGGFNVALSSGMAIINAKVEALDSTIMLIDNKENGIGYHQLYDGKFIVDGKTIAAISTSDEELQKEIKGSNSGQETIVLSGSLQGKLENMDGEYGDTWNDTKKDDEDYVGPVNGDGTKLIEFDVNKEINKVANEDVNDFTYYDPNTGSRYDYVFKYNTDETDLTGEGNNAYLWTPASLLHYDATEGLINYLGTAGVLKYGSSKTIQNDLALAGLYTRFTQDITIYGNCMALAEKILATASREDYVFLGWFIADDVELASKYAEEENFEELYKLLNTEFTGMTKLEIDGKPVSELTVYAKWGKKDTGKTDPEIDPPHTGVNSEANRELFITLFTLLQASVLAFYVKNN